MNVQRQKERFLKAFEQSLAQLYDGEKVLGKKPIHWGMCCGCYILLYSALAAMFSSLLALYFGAILDFNIPKYATDGFLTSPGLAFLPQEPTGRSNLIRWVRGDDDDVDIWSQLISAYMQNYDNKEIEGDNVNVIDCTTGRKDFNPEKVCNWDLQVQMGPCVQVDDYGFDDGFPCLVFRLNKIVDWMPENYAPDEVPEEIKDIWKNNTIAFTCEGSDAASREHIGEYEYYPQQGFSFDYFPYRNQIGYLSPLVGVVFNNVKTNQILFLECRIWAKNIIYDKAKRLGMVEIEFLSD